MLFLPHHLNNIISSHFLITAVCNLFRTQELIYLLIGYVFLGVTKAWSLISIQVTWRKLIILLLSELNNLIKSLFKYIWIFRIIHLFYDLSPHPFINCSRLNLIEHFVDLNFTFERILILKQYFKQIIKSIFNVHLNESELFITLRFKNFSKKSYIVVIWVESLYTINNCNNPFDNQVFKTIFLVEICVHVLLHWLSSLVTVLAFLVKFNLLTIHILNSIL